MANPVKMSDYKSALINATTSDDFINVDGYRSYTVSHTGFSNTGVSSTATIVFEYESETVTAANLTEGANKLVLVPGSSIIITSDVQKLAFKTVSGSAVFNCIPMQG